MSEQFKIGDIVVLKSGGPRMTIQNIKDKVAVCSWFDDQDQRLHTERFDVQAIQVTVDS